MRGASCASLCTPIPSQATPHTGIAAAAARVYVCVCVRVRVCVCVCEPWAVCWPFTCHATAFLYRRFVANSLRRLGALDDHVISDDERIEGAAFPPAMAAKSERYRVLKPQYAATANPSEVCAAAASDRGDALGRDAPRVRCSTYQ